MAIDSFSWQSIRILAANCVVFDLNRVLKAKVKNPTTSEQKLFVIVPYYAKSSSVFKVMLASVLYVKKRTHMTAAYVIFKSVYN